MQCSSYSEPVSGYGVGETVLALGEAKGPTRRSLISPFGIEVADHRSKTGRLAAPRCAAFEGSLYSTDRLNTKPRSSLDSVNQMTCRAVWQVYGEGESFQLAQET